MSITSEPEPIIYRTEVLGIIGALADIVVELRWLRDDFEEDDEEEEDEGGAWSGPARGPRTTQGFACCASSRRRLGGSRGAA